MLSINTNLSSLITQRSAKQSTNILNQSIERMTTGYKINHAKDNAANYSIVNNMSTKINSLMVAEDNVAQGLDLISTAESTLNILENRVTRLRDLQEQASNGTYGADSLKAINSECNALIDEINRLYETSQYNGINLFLETTTLADGREVVVKESDAELDTTFKDLGITSREFEVYDSNNNLIQAYDLEEDDTVRDFFTVLQSHGFTTSLGNGEIALSSVDDYHIGGLLADELGISTARQSFISQTEQSGSMEIETTSANVSSTTIYTTTTNEVTQTNTIWTTTTTTTTTTNTITVTATVEQTVTQTIPVTTTTEQTVTETTEVDKTVGVAKNSSSAITYETEQEEETYYYSVIMSSTIGVTVTTLMYAAETINISPTYCETVADLENLILSTFSDLDYLVWSGDSYTTDFVTMTYEIKWTGRKSSTPNPQYPQVKFDTTTTSYGVNYLFGSSSNLRRVYETTTATVTTTAVSSTKLSTIGLTSTQYITVQNNGTQTIITCRTSDTIGSVTAKLTSAGITASLSSGKISLSASDNSYISGMSSALMTALNLSGDFSSVKRTTTEVEKTITVTTTTESTSTSTIWVTTTTQTTQTETTYTTTSSKATQTATVYVTSTNATTQTSTVWITSTVSATGATTFEEAGVNRSFKVTIMSEGTKNVLNITKDTSFADFYNELQARGFNITENVDSISFVGQGDTYLKSTELNNLLRFSALNKTEAERTINTDSDHLTYNEILENVYAPGKVNLQVGVNGDSNSQVEVDVSFKLGAVNGLRNIGLDTTTDYLTQIDSVLADIREKQTHLGAASNRLESALDEISIQYENLVSSRSTIRDADIADETSNYIQAQILQQAAATLMATANQSPSIALQLI